MYGQMMTNFEELSLDGFQIVRSDMFTHVPRKGEPTCTIWPTRVAFNKFTLHALNSCEFVRIEVNPRNRCMIVVPVSSKEKDSIRWIKGRQDQQIRNLESKAFGEELYKNWGLDKDFNYRAIGRLVTANKKVILLFDFTGAENWRSSKAGNKGE